MEELKSIFYFTVFLKQRQISGGHYTELLNANSRACGASFADYLTWLQVFPIIENGPETNFATTAVVNMDLSQKQ